jgi:hypothetical protein
MKKTYFLFISFLALITSCQIDDGFDVEYIPHPDTDFSDNDTTEYVRRPVMSKTMAAQNDEMRFLSINAYAFIDNNDVNAKYWPNADTSVVVLSTPFFNEDIAISAWNSNLKITVTRINITITYDNTYHTIIPRLNTNVTEPQQFGEWSDLPDGIYNKPQNVFEDSIKIVPSDDYQVDVCLQYVVRNRDDKLADGYSESYECRRYTQLFKLSDDTPTMNLPIELVSVKFSASVSDYNSSANGNE